MGIGDRGLRLHIEDRKMGIMNFGGYWDCGWELEIRNLGLCMS